MEHRTILAGIHSFIAYALELVPEKGFFHTESKVGLVAVDCRAAVRMWCAFTLVAARSQLQVFVAVLAGRQSGRFFWPAQANFTRNFRITK